MANTVIQLTDHEARVARDIGGGSVAFGIEIALRQCPMLLTDPDSSDYAPAPGSRPRRVVISDAMRERAEKQGGGKISRGVRMALDWAEEHLFDIGTEEFVDDLRYLEGDTKEARFHNDAVQRLRAWARATDALRARED